MYPLIVQSLFKEKKVVLGPLNNYIQRMKLEHSLTPYTKINSKCIRVLNISLDTIKLLQENIGRTLNIQHSKIFFDPPPRVMEINTKIKKIGPNET